MNSLIVHEGPDGLGKTTVAETMVEKVESSGYRSKLFREPGGSELGEVLRPIIKSADIPRLNRTDVLLFAAQRSESAPLVRRAQKKGYHVVSDRSWLSSVAYQGYAGGEDPVWVKDVNVKAVGDDFLPDLWLIFDADYEVSEERQREQKKDRYEGNRDFYNRVREGYLTEAETMSMGGEIIRLIDASLPLEQVIANVWKEIQEVL